MNRSNKEQNHSNLSDLYNLQTTEKFKYTCPKNIDATSKVYIYIDNAFLL